MARKIILLADPGIDTAYALALALFDPQLDVLAIAATAGNVRAEQATRNVHILVEHFDPPKWPRLGEALPIHYDVEGTHLHGPGGLGGVELQCVELHHPHPSDKLIVDELHRFPGEVTVVTLGPLTVLARAMDRDPDLPKLIQQFVILGGSHQEPGNASAVAEFHFYCDPLAARQVVRSTVPTMLVPLDLMRKTLFSPRELMELPSGESRACQLLRKIVPFGIAATAQQYRIEGFHLKDVLGVAAVALPQAFKTKPVPVEVETRGDLTRGMSVFDFRSHTSAKPNVELATDVDMKAVRGYMERIFQKYLQRDDSD